MDALQLFGLRYDAVHAGFVDDILDRLSDEQARAQPHGLNSVAWLLWHVARVEDVAVNRFVADRPQVLLTGGWNGRLGIDRADVGAGMTSAEVDDLSRRIDLTALRDYWAAVARATGEVANGLGPADLDAVVDPAHIRRVVRDERVLVPAGGWVGDSWASSRSCGWFLLQTALLHPYGHLFDGMTVRGLVTA
ncbi:MAG: DinB family protein [Chloroflexia bacterium]|nr:DinB family protein [Chloroflexia bacterium]